MANSNLNCDLLMYVINNRLSDLNWFEKFELNQVSSLVEQIERNAERLCEAKSEKDEAVLKLFTITFEVIRKLLHNYRLLKSSSNQSPLGIETLCSTKGQNCDSLSPSSVKEGSSGSDEKFENTASSIADSGTFSRMSRGSGRSSILTSDINVWIDSADRTLNKIKNRSNFKDSNSDSCSKSFSDSNDSTESLTVKLKNEAGPLGIHVVPYLNAMNEEAGLLIQGIEPGGRIDRDGRFKVNDKIVQINDDSLVEIDFMTAQSIFKKALSASEINLKLIREKDTKDSVFVNNENLIHTSKLKDDVQNQDMIDLYKPSLDSSLPMTTGKVSNNLLTFSKRNEKRFHIRLIKNEDGLGFSLTTKDNPSSDPNSIFVKTILPKGSASKDGRLRPGDKVLEVNGILVSTKSHSEVVTVLRSIPLKASVDLIISRYENETTHCLELPRQLPPQKEEDLSNSRQREVLTFHIPLNDTSSAGLGLSVKGKKCTHEDQSSVDLGLFVKSVINGGAASKDGRLMSNDQLVSINGISLLGLSNSQAMETIRRAMFECSGPESYPDALTLTIARPIFVTEEVKPGQFERNDSIMSSHSTGEEQIISQYFNQISKSSSELSGQEQINSELSVSNPFLSEPTLFNEFYSLSEKKPHGVNLVQDQKREICVDGDKDDEDQEEAEEAQEEEEVVEVERDEEEEDEEEEEAEVKTRTTCYIVGENIKRVSTESDKDLIGFHRDGFGRQSMSEKRNAMMSTKSVDHHNQTFEEAQNLEKEIKEVNLAEEQNKINSVTDKYQSSTLRLNSSKPKSKIGFKKSTSLDNLITIVQKYEKQLHDADTNPVVKPKPIRLKMSRCKNESFRAAVDKSYNCPTEGPSDYSMVHPVDYSMERTVNYSSQRLPDNSVERSSQYINERSVDYPNERPVDCPISMEMINERRSDNRSYIHHSDAKRFIATDPVASFTEGQKANALRVTNHNDNREDDGSTFEKKKELFKSKKLIKNLLKLGSKKEITSWIKKKPSFAKEDKENVKGQVNEKVQSPNKTADFSSNFLTNSDLDSSIIEVQPTQNTLTGLQLVKSSGEEYQTNREDKLITTNHLGSNVQNLLSNYKLSDGGKVQELQSKQTHPANMVRLRANGYETGKEAIERPGSRVELMDNKHNHYINYKDLLQFSNQYQTLRPRKVQPVDNYSTMQSSKRHNSNFQAGSGFIQLSPSMIQELRRNDQLIHGYVENGCQNWSEIDSNHTYGYQPAISAYHANKNLAETANLSYASNQRYSNSIYESRKPIYQQLQQPIYDNSHYNGYYHTYHRSNQAMHLQPNYTYNSQ